MRSLTLLSVSSHLLLDPSSSQSISQISNDPNEDGIYAIAEESSLDGLVEVQIFNLADGASRKVVKIDTEAVAGRRSVVSFKYLPESDTLCVVLANGDIEVVEAPGSGGEVKHEVVGSIDAGIKAAEWSPDEELLAVITGDDKLIAMTKDYEVLSEGPMRTTDFGEDAPVNVGWGEKSTQFHGSVGKSAASTSTNPLDSLKSSPDDDGLPRISWRGDSAFFSVSSLDDVTIEGSASGKRRTVRVFSRVAALSSTSEPTGGLEHSLAWQRSGSIIASTQKVLAEDGATKSHHVVFFERNGLRRYDFALRELGLVVQSMEWNSDSTLLAVWAKRGDDDVVQLWHRNNYCWYLKQEIAPQALGTASLTSIFWHPERALDLYVTTTRGIDTYELCWDVFASTRAAPEDDGSVAVVDGSHLKLTPFRLVNIPPPMSAITLASSRPSQVPVHVTFSSTSSHFFLLYADGVVEIWNWALPAPVRGKSREEILEPTLLRTALASAGYALQVAALGSGDSLAVAVLLETTKGRVLSIIDAQGSTREIKLSGDVKRLVAGSESFVLEDAEGTILEVLNEAESDVMPSESFIGLPEFCGWIRPIISPTLNTIIGLSSSGRLYSGANLLASNATSFSLTSSFLIFSTFSHEARFIPLFALESSFASAEALVSHTESLKKPQGAEAGGEIKRALERGSRIVTVVPSSTSLILQMPRGNLETIAPRPLVLQIVRQDIENLRYRAAFLACRRHRIDLNILFDHAPHLFQSNLTTFVSKIKDVEYLNLFLSGLKNEDVTITMYKPLRAVETKPKPPTNKINLICDLVRGDLEQRDPFHYANTVLTAHVRKSPPDYESALRTLVELKARDATRAEDAIKYIIFLSDANKLFDLALGMYDFSLVLMIAQHSQKDPREYLPFLRELRQLPKYVQQHRIDDHLERYESALVNISKAGDEQFEAALSYARKHNLYSTALQAYRDDPAHYKTVLGAYAEHLFDNRDYSESGLMFSLGGQPSKAMEAYEKANAWQELFTLALGEGKRPASEIKNMAVGVADRLKGKRRFDDAGKVLLEYGRDVDAAVAAYVEGASFAEAVRLSSLYMRKDLVDTYVKPGLLEVQSRLEDEFSELEDQVETQVARLLALREKRDENPTAYNCLDDPASAFDNVDVQPDGASDAGTAFTRYTAAPTSFATSRQSSTTARSRRRAVLKKAAGKKGTIFEETYLLQSLTKTMEGKLAEYQAEVAPLLPVFLSINSPAHRTAAFELQSALAHLEDFLQKKAEETWGWKELEWREEQIEENAQKQRGEFVQPPPPEEGKQKVLRPKIATTKWRLGLLDSM